MNIHKPNRYFVLEFPGILRAAQHALDGAQAFWKPGWIIIGPTTPEEFRDRETWRRAPEPK